MDVTAAVVEWAGVLVMAATAGYTYLLARRARQTLDETRKQRALAEGQANSARESAEAASKQAYAAVDSARSARESVDLARTSLHRTDQPRFELSGEEHEGGTLRVAGPPEVSVHGSWSASSSGADDEDGDVRRIDHHRGSTTLYKVVLGDRIIVPVTGPEWADQATIRLDPDVRRDWRR